MAFIREYLDGKHENLDDLCCNFSYNNTFGCTYSIFLKSRFTSRIVNIIDDHDYYFASILVYDYISNDEFNVVFNSATEIVPLPKHIIHEMLAQIRSTFPKESCNSAQYKFRRFLIDYILKTTSLPMA